MPTEQVLEYKCPCCDAGLIFGEDTQQMICEYCGNTFDLETVKAFHESQNQASDTTVEWEDNTTENLTQEETDAMRAFVCPACAGEIVSDENTAATFCPYCGNPAILPSRVAGGLKPDGVIPFRMGKEDAKAEFLKLCKGKPLLPKFFTEDQHVEKLTGIYVPFWLYSCGSDFQGRYNATRIHRWSDARYDYTRTEHFLLHRGSTAQFANIPVDASQKMDNVIMESIEPYDYSQMVDFETAYLSGFFADKYDVESKDGEDRIRQRVVTSMDDLLSSSFLGYHSVIPTSTNLKLTHSKAKYVLLPVWLLYSKYQDKTYVFAMNGQTGKMTGTFPVCPKRTALWFSGITAAANAVAAVIQLLLF